MKFHGTLTGSGANCEWVVKADPTAPSQPNVLAQISADDTSYRFPLAVNDEGSFQDMDVSVRFKPVSGGGDQAAGLVWRLKDANNSRGEWSSLRVTAQGKLFTVYFNDQRLYEVEDETIKDAGKVGLWTKADSVAHFDDLRVIAR